MKWPKTFPDATGCTLEADLHLDKTGFFEELASMGYAAKPDSTCRDTITWFDSQGGSLYSSDHRLTYSTAGKRWSLSRSGAIIAECEGVIDSPPTGGELPRVLENLAKGNPFVPQLVMEVERTDYYLKSPVIIGILLSFEPRSYHAPGEEEPRKEKTVVQITSEMDSPSQVAYLVRLITERFDLSVIENDGFTAGLHLLALPLPGAPVPKDLKVQSSDSYERVCLKTVGLQGYRMWANTPGTCRDADHEYLHDLRVATRRARFALKLFEDVVGAEYAGSLRAELKWIASLLGEVRDLDVFLVRIHDHMSRIHSDTGFARLVEDHLNLQRLAHLENLRSALREERYTELVNALRALPDHPVSGSSSAAKTGSRLIFKTAKKFHRLLDMPAAELGMEDLHRIRIKFKRLRYISEFFRPFFGKKLGGHIKTCIAFQDRLGLLNDATVAERNLRKLAKALSGKLSDTDLLSLGALIQLQRSIAEEQRLEFIETWNDFRRNLDDLLDTTKGVSL